MVKAADLSFDLQVTCVLLSHDLTFCTDFSTFQVDIQSSGEVSVAAGESSNIFLDVALDITGTYDLTHGKIYAGSLGPTPAHWLLCRE